MTELEITAIIKNDGCEDKRVRFILINDNWTDDITDENIYIYCGAMSQSIVHALRSKQND